MKTLSIGLPLCSLAAVAWVALAQQRPPELLRQANGEVLLTSAAPAGGFYRIEYSSDLQNWQGLATVKSTGSDQWVDSTSIDQAQRFYRAVALSESGVLTGDHLATSAGDAILHPIGHASVVVRWNGKVLYSDPSGNAPLFNGLPKADLVVVTHTHGDHFSSSVISSLLGPEGQIFVPQSVFTALPANLKEKAKVLANGESATAHGMSVEALGMYNMSNTNHPKGVGNGYVVTLGDKRVYFSGDTEDIPEMRALKNIDTAFVCMSLPSNMTVAAAASAVREFRPRVAIPYHYRQSGTTFETARFKQLVGTDVGVDVRLRPFY